MPHALSLRVPDDLYEEAKTITRRRRISFNALVEETLRKEIAAEQEREMYEAASLLAEDAESNVDFAFFAQFEVVLRDHK